MGDQLSYNEQRVDDWVGCYGVLNIDDMRYCGTATYNAPINFSDLTLPEQIDALSKLRDKMTGAFDGKIDELKERMEKRDEA